MKILVLNAGSSSQKSSLYDLSQELPTHPPNPLWEGTIDWTIQPGTANLKVKANGRVWQEALPTASKTEATRQLLTTLWQGETQVLESPQAIDVVGHRVVHGGEDYRQSTLITDSVKAAIARLALFAPIHNPINLEGINTIEQILGLDVPQVAVFDTAFHAHLAPAAYVYPGPYDWLAQGIRRYGFHGTSHQYCAERIAQLLGRDLKDLRLITCHLGNGASLAAIRNGHSVDTTMGFTPLEGLMMGTRSGSIDPGILIYLMREQGYTADQLDSLLNQQSGLQGISGIGADMRQILTAIAEGNPRAQLALDMYIHHIRSAVGSMLGALGGLDAIAFTAGVGENVPLIRAATCEPFECLGMTIDPEKNDPEKNDPEKNTHIPNGQTDRARTDRDIATADAKVRILVIHTQEDWAIAQACWRLFRQ